MKILIIVERPIQNDLPYKILNSLKTLSVEVLCINNTAGKLKGNENLNQSVFSNKSLYQFPYQFLNSLNSLLKLVKQADLVVIHGHFHPIFRKAILLTKLFRKKLILTSDATSLEGIAGSNGWKIFIKPFLFRVLYNQIADALFVPSNASKNYFEKIGINAQKIVLTPYTVNEQFILNSLQNSDTGKLRESFGINLNDIIFLFCGKLIHRKRASDLLYAFALINNSSAKLIIIGDGPLKESLNKLAIDLKIAKQLIFTGLVPYNELPAFYEIANVLVVPAEHEPYGLPVNEAMICGTPVIASNAVGAAGDLIEEGVTGFIYQVADIESLTKKMKLFIDQPLLKYSLSNNCKTKMQSWSSQSNVDAQIHFFEQKGWLA